MTLENAENSVFPWHTMGVNFECITNIGANEFFRAPNARVHRTLVDPLLLNSMTSMLELDD